MEALRADRPALLRLVATGAVVILLSLGSLTCVRHAERKDTTPSKRPVAHPVEPSWPTDLPGTPALPFPPSEAEKTWSVGPDKTLVAHRVGEPEFCICYYLAAFAKCMPIVGAVREAEVRAVSATSIELICHGLDGGPFVPFPYLLIYDVASSKTEERYLLQNPQQPVEFGMPGIERGQLLMSARLVTDGVELQFGTASDVLSKYAGPISYVPYTLVQWNCERGGLALRFTGTEPAQGVAGQVADLAGGCVLGALLEHGGNSSVLVLRLSEPREYYITHTQGDLCTMRVHFRQ